MIEPEKPVVTFILFSYNQEKYIREAVESILSQDYSPLEIILSDDCSSDKTFSIMKEMADEYEGPHKILIRCNIINKGFAEHINQVVLLATGRLIVVSAGDDLSESNRTSVLVDFWLQHGAPVCSLFSAMSEIDKNSQLTGKIYRSFLPWTSLNPIDLIRLNASVFGAAHAWSADVMSSFPPLHTSVINEDSVIPFRASLLGGVMYVDKVLVKYRANIGLASNFGQGVMPAKVAARNSGLLKRPYVVCLQKVSDLRWINYDKSEIYAMTKSRRADYLFRYWLSINGKFTVKRVIFFARRCRFAWLIREIYFKFIYL